MTPIIHIQNTFQGKQIPLKINKIRLVACGTAYHSCLMAKYWIEEFTSIDVEADFASEFRYRNVKLNKTTSLGVDQIKFKDKKSVGLKLDLNEMQNWRFASEKIEIKDDIWTEK